MSEKSGLDLGVASIRLGAAVKEYKVEKTAEAEQELLEATLDVYYAAAGGELWNEGYILSSDQAGLKDKFFTDGAVISFFPVPLLGVNDEEETHKIGVFTFSKRNSNEGVMATMGVECDLIEGQGHRNLKGQFRFPAADESVKGMTKDDFVRRISIHAQGVINDLKFR